MDAALGDIAKKYVWWKTPSDALSHRDHFLCQLMQLGTLDDVLFVRARLGDPAFREALNHAPSGVLDAKSWNFWNLVYFGAVPPMPERPLPR